MTDISLLTLRYIIHISSKVLVTKTDAKTLNKAAISVLLHLHTFQNHIPSPAMSSDQVAWRYKQWFQIGHCIYELVPQAIAKVHVVKQNLAEHTIPIIVSYTKATTVPR